VTHRFEPSLHLVAETPTGWLGREDSNLRMAESKSGYKVVFMKPKFAVATIASYDEAITKQVKGP